MLNFLLFDGAKLLCNNHNAKKKHFARLAKEDYNLIRVGLQPDHIRVGLQPASKWQIHATVAKLTIFIEKNKRAEA